MKAKEIILETNIKQKEFYNTKKKNYATNAWSKIRNGILNKIKKNIGIQNQSYNLHKEWFGDLASKKVLDLGCFSGNYLSIYLAENAKEYIGIDLSDIAIKKLNERLEHVNTAKALAVDFLSDDFTSDNFDLIYAYGVLHHFEDTAVVIDRLNEKLAFNGEIISYDPLQTSFPVKVLRTIYRPFQSDAAWEWPFTKKTFYKFQNSFDVIERRGILGKSKWITFINILPISVAKKKKIGQKWHEEDWEKSKTSDSILFGCMHLTMLMKKKS